MLRPAAVQILKNDESYYSLVIAIAKRAREITQTANDDEAILDDRPVKMAVEEFARGEYRLIEDPSLSG